jgi:adenylosuccinate synthase
MEGAQGALLDLDWGTYPFVTSSSPIAGGACTGGGIPVTAVDQVIGVAKVYTTRVGNGPFPTEFPPGDFAESFRRRAGEFGATTGRPRRCGWFDLVAMRHAVRINGFTELVLTKFDILDGCESVQLATAYRLGERSIRELPEDLRRLEEGVMPVYETLPGWEGSAEARSWAELPEAALRYLERLERELGTPIRWIGNGPARDRLLRRP